MPLACRRLSCRSASRPHHMLPILNAHFWMHYIVYRPASHACPAMLYPATAYEENLMHISVCASYKFGFLPHYILPQFMDHFHCMQLHVSSMQACLPACHCPSTFLCASFLLACPPVCHIIIQAAFVFALSHPSVGWSGFLSESHFLQPPDTQQLQLVCVHIAV